MVFCSRFLSYCPITPHKYTHIESGRFYQDDKIIDISCTCSICESLRYGIIGKEAYVNEDLNVLNFERIKWGDIRHVNIFYTLFDLEQFKKEHTTAFTKTDIEIFKNILNAAESC